MPQKEELHRLRKENRELKKKLYKLEMATYADSEQPKSHADCYKARTYFSFLLSRLRAKDFYEKAARYFRNSLWITRIFRWGVLLYQYLQAGAFVLLYFNLFSFLVRKRGERKLDFFLLCGDFGFLVFDALFVRADVV